MENIILNVQFDFLVNSQFFLEKYECKIAHYFLTSVCHDNILFQQEIFMYP